MTARICSRVPRGRKRRSRSGRADVELMRYYRDKLLKRQASVSQDITESLAIETDGNQKPRSSVAQSIAAATQLGLLAVALYGLFLTETGDRLFELLKGDIDSAERELIAARSEKVEVESLLDQERDRLIEARFARVAVERRTELLNFELDQSRASLIFCGRACRRRNE